MEKLVFAIPFAMLSFAAVSALKQSSALGGAEGIAADPAIAEKRLPADTAMLSK